LAWSHPPHLITLAGVLGVGHGILLAGLSQVVISPVSQLDGASCSFWAGARQFCFLLPLLTHPLGYPFGLAFVIWRIAGKILASAF